MDFYQEANDFLERAWSRLNPYHNGLANLSIDHLCYRTTTLTHYEQVKRFFGELGIELIESMIGGRPIATYKLHRPIHFRGFQIELVEVPAPKENKPSVAGLEHFEFVIPYSFAWVREIFSAEKISEKGASKLLNPEIEVTFEDFAIKFHHKSLEEVIAIEKHPKLCDLIDRYGLLINIKEFTPLISGTIPLQINTDDSDLDLLCQSADLKHFEEICQQHWGNLPSYRCHRALFQNLESSVVDFTVEGLKVEIFCQDEEVFKQNANRHYYAQSKLLKLLGPKFRSDVKKLRAKGLKTEPAFGELLGLNSPYEELLQISLESEGNLAKRFGTYSP